MTIPIPDGTPPGVPRRRQVATDELAVLRDEISRLRQTFYGTVRSTDGLGNQAFATAGPGDGFGASKPRVHVPGYQTLPYLATAGATPTTWQQLYAHTFKPEYAQINTSVRWAVAENAVLNVAVGEFEWRWSLGQFPLTRLSATLIDTWDSGSGGSKGATGNLVRNSTYVWPTTGIATVQYWDPTYVTVALWARLKPGASVNDVVRVAPLGLYQSGLNQG